MQYLTSVQTGCIVKGEAQKSPLFWRFSGGLWFSQDRLFSRNSTRRPLNLVKSSRFLQTPLVKSTCLYNAPSMHTVESFLILNGATKLEEKSQKDKWFHLDAMYTPRLAGSQNLWTSPQEQILSCLACRDGLETLTSLNKEVRPFVLGDNSIWSFPSVSPFSDYSIWRSWRLF